VPNAPSRIVPESDCPVIVLASGQTLKIQRVRLYEADKVKEVALLKASAAKHLGGVSTGIGFWGSPAWVLGGAAALGIVEGILSNASTKQGMELLKTVQTRLLAMAHGALYFDSTKLINTNLPHPHSWSAIGTATQFVDLSQLNWISRKSLLRQHNKSESDVQIINGAPHLAITKEGTQFVHDGDEFVNLETAIGIINVRWSHVVAYFPPQRLPKP
jgi:hypothetical protein